MSLKKVLVIGSGPIVIGQAAEFDYSGTQACKMLQKEGIKVVLVNNNPATIMTDTQFADSVYLEPLTIEYLEAIISKERPDGVLVGMGGQASLNLATALYDKGIFTKYNVHVMGTSISAIKESEDREAFKLAMERIGEPVIESAIATDIQTGLLAAITIGFPLVLRPAYTLGGSGGSIVQSENDFKEKCLKAIDYSPVGQVLIEKSVYGWKEIEYEVVRDAKGNSIIVCNMENIDPVGIHTGDSIVVAPSQTLSDKDHQMLRTSALKIVGALNIVGACNVQFALSPDSFEYFVIEVNPRVSRSSALASKATGYPIAKVATKIALGYSLDEIRNEVTQTTMACFEPALDYCVVKIPRWPFDQLMSDERKLGTSMMATGEVMAIGNNFENALMKAVRSLELGYFDLSDDDSHKMNVEDLKIAVERADDKRLFHLAELMRRGYSVDAVYQLSAITPYFLEKIFKMVQLEEYLKMLKLEDITPEDFLAYKRAGISDKGLAKAVGVSPRTVYEKRLTLGILPTYKMVDTCSAEFEANSNYFYSSYDTLCESVATEAPKVIVIGSGPIRIGQGVEFDYCSVHGVLTLKKLGYEAIIINNNPETVSTDFDISDKLYFEPITEEDVLNILNKEKPLGVILQYGGQTAIKLASFIDSMEIPILGTSFANIDKAEDRKQFDQMLAEQSIRRPIGRGIWTLEEGLAFADEVGFPLLVRPSYVIGGLGMEVVWKRSELESHLKRATTLSLKAPILIDQYLDGMEIEVDALSDGENILIPGIMEHLEKAGVHSGDSSSIYPARIDQAVEEELVEITKNIAKALEVKGILNIQFILSMGKLYVIEVNPRASRTVPFLSKVTGISMIEVSTELIMGKKLSALKYGTGLMKKQPVYAIKTPIFSMEKIPGVDTALGPVMKSTGETMSIDRTFELSMYKSFVIQGFGSMRKRSALVSIGGNKKEESLEAIQYLEKVGFSLYATQGTKVFLEAHGCSAQLINKIDEGDLDCIQAMNQSLIGLVINIPSGGKKQLGDGFRIRRKALEMRIPCVMNTEKLHALVAVIASKSQEKPIEVFNISDLTLKF